MAVGPGHPMCIVWSLVPWRCHPSGWVVSRVPGRWECVCNFYPKIVLDLLSTMNSNSSTYRLATASVCSLFGFIYFERIVYRLWRGLLTLESTMYKAVMSVEFIGHCVIQSPWKCNAGTLLKTKYKGPQTIELRVAENAFVRYRWEAPAEFVESFIGYSSLLWILYFLRQYM